MNRYWTRIALGALIVFGVGLTGMFAVREAKARVGILLSTAAVVWALAPYHQRMIDHRDQAAVGRGAPRRRGPASAGEHRVDRRVGR